ncbi:hypothetical protein SXIM_41160 [Streptomyces xiamenensis]|uniref:Uncharacterized protein n=1 Tax=Streptomyces xiamenensis TaxID=408015 RepID=A0A0F7FZE4_9ACTN|nr:hypothetical protein [Streptomyces xiamenensis]AKG45500.1 hypothetical protein SXIM_41160 [Streptomyces xiamenensis]
MLVTASAVLLLGLAIWFLLRIRYLRWLDVLLCGAFGFLLSRTVAAPLVSLLLSEVNGLLGQMRF